MPTKSASRTITRDPDWLGPAIPPGEILLEEYLKPLGIGQVEVARRLDISLNRLNEIVLGKRGITADTALRLSDLLKTSAQLWMRLQATGISQRPSIPKGGPETRRDLKTPPALVIGEVSARAIAWMPTARTRVSMTTRRLGSSGKPG